MSNIHGKGALNGKSPSAAVQQSERGSEVKGWRLEAEGKESKK